MKRILTFIGLVTAFIPQLFAQLPTDNPYLINHPDADKHWTQSLKWNDVTNAAKVKGLIRKSSVVDSVIFSKVAGKIQSQGGGVLYFPRGTYYFHFNVEVPSGLIIRGVTPSYAATDVDKPGLPTRFVFPKFNPYLQGQKTPSDYDGREWESCRVRRIEISGEQLQNAALVYIDINRSLIDFSNKDFDQPVDEQLLEKASKNILLLGLRLNNASIPDPAIPSVYAKAHENGWQHWPWELAANINLVALENVCVTNCLFNNQPTDNYRQNNYKLDDGMTFDGFEAMYKMTDHPAIAINHPPMDNLSKAKEPLASVEVKGNHILVSKGNQGIVFPDRESVVEDNQIAYIDEPQNVVIRGREAPAYDYNILQRKPSMSKAFVHTNHYKDTLPYRLIEPMEKQEGEKYPLVLYLHDFTSKGEDNISHLRHFVWQMAQDSIRKKYPCYILTPQLTTKEIYWRGRYNFSLTWPLYTSMQIVDEVIKNYPVDIDRVYVIGAGIGGDAVWDLTLFYPDKFAAAACLGGVYHFTPVAARQVSHIPFWIVWGQEDEWLTKELKVISTMDLKLLGAPVKIVDLPNTGKKCWNNIFEDVPGLLPGIFQHRRGSGSLSAKAK